MKLLLVLAGLHLLAVLLLLVVRLREALEAPHRLRGSDLYMARWARDNGRRAYAGFLITFDAGADWGALRATIAENLQRELDRPGTPLALDVDLAALRLLRRPHPPALAEVLELLDTAEAGPEALLSIRDGAARPLVLRLDVRQPRLFVLFDHTLWDGIRLVNEVVVPVLQCAPFPDSRLLQPRALPILAEVGEVYTAYALGLRRLTHTTLAPLAHSHAQQVFIHRLPVAEVRALRDQAGVRFVAALAALWGKRLLSWLEAPRSRLRIGVIVAFSSERYRNNYSMALIDVYAAHDLRTAARSVERQLSRHRREIRPLYTLMNTVELQSALKESMMDCLLSPTVFERERGPSLCIEGVSLLNLPSSCPLYTFTCSVGDTIQIATTRNTAAIREDRIAAEAEEIYGFSADYAVMPLRERAPRAR